MSRKLILGLIVICCILCISSVSASEINNETINDTQDDLLLQVENVEVIGEVEVPDVPDLFVNKTVYVDSKNIEDIFIDGALQSKYANKTLIFSGDFENFGKLVIDINNVTLIGTGSNMKNVVFDVSGQNVTLDGFTMDLDSNFADNDGAAIQVSSDNINLINLNINYVVPTNVEAYGIFGAMSQRNPLRNLKILNSTINFEGHNNQANVYNCGIKLINCHDTLIENNTIITSLPLRDVNFGAHGATLDSDYVMSVGLEGCKNFTLKGNEIISDVNYRPSSQYPTLDGILVSQSDNSLICDNSVYMTDFITKPDIDNYLYGIDIYALNNLTITRNSVSIVTTGGKLAAGTAYPVQITGPIDQVNVTDNDLYTYSNGPNIGIYSHNYYGRTALSITNNRINVTGLAGVHEWALVAGIESQDSNSTIKNNTIEVHSVGTVNIGDNIYGVSYRQHIAGNHTYDIQNNTVFSDGFYSVSILDSVNSTIADNLLISFNENATNSNKGYNYGDMASHKGDQFYNNRVIRYVDYYASINNIGDGGNEYNYVQPTNDRNLDNTIDGKRIVGEDIKKSYSYNPLIPGSSNGKNSIDESDDGKDKGDSGNSGIHSGDSDGDGQSSIGIGGNGSSSSGVVSLKDLLSSFIKSNGDGTSDNSNNMSTNDGNSDNNNDVTSDDGSNVNTRSNDTDVTPSAEGTESLDIEPQSMDSSSSQGAASPSASQDSSASKAFELKDLTKHAFIPSVFFVIIILILLVVGFKRKNSNFD